MAPLEGIQPAGSLLIVDGHAYAYRSFHAIRVLNTPTGQAVNAVFGFIKSIQKILDQVKPTHCLVVWDGGLSETRLQILPEYKAQRPSMPESLSSQIPLIQKYLDAAGIAWYCQQGVEADDWIATVAHQAQASMDRIIVASADKDFMQLVSSRIGLWNPNGSETEIWDANSVIRKTGVKPEQIVDWLCLIGDAVDNIKGVDGVGPKTATSLLNQFGSVAGILDHIAEIKSGSLREKIQAGKDRLSRNQELIRLKDQLPGKVEWGRMNFQLGDPEKLKELFQEFGFKSLLKQVDESKQKQTEFLI